MSFRIDASCSNSLFCDSSKAERWGLGSSHISKGNRGAKGAIAMNSWFSAITRTPLSASCRMMSEDAAFPVAVILFGSLDLLDDALGNDGKRDQLGVCVFERGPGGVAVVFENQNVLEAPVLFEVEDPVAEGPEHVFDARHRHRRQGQVVVRRLNDHLVRADAVHLVVETF